jgi:hypothetical protein
MAVLRGQALREHGKHMNPSMELAALREVHMETLRLLREVDKYLMRLPAVPLTRELCRKIEDHLSDPARAAVNEAARVNDARSLHGGIYSPAGIPLLQVSLEGSNLTLRTGIPKSTAGESANVDKLVRVLRTSTTIWLLPYPA